MIVWRRGECVGRAMGEPDMGIGRSEGTMRSLEDDSEGRDLEMGKPGRQLCAHPSKQL